MVHCIRGSFTPFETFGKEIGESSSREEGIRSPAHGIKEYYA